MTINPLRQTLAVSLLAASVALPAGAAVAQTTGDEQAYVIEEITVTARKRGAESLQDIPTSISAITSDMMEKMGVTEFTDFAYQVPGLTFTDEGPGEKRYIIRGIQSAGQQQVAVYYDEVALPGVQSSTSDSGSQTTDLQLYDMERIEVLRGPQGTTFGANSQTGTVRFITNKPNLSEWEASARAEVSSTDSADENVGAFVMGNFPIVTDKLGLRVVGYYTSNSGYVDNVRLGFDDLNDSENIGIRGILRFQPTPRFTVDAMVWLQERDLDNSPRYHPFDSFSLDDNPNGIGDRDNVADAAQFQTGKFQVGDYTLTPKPDNQRIASLTANWDLGPAAVTATGSFYNREFDFKFDSTWILFALGVGPEGATCPSGDPCVRPDLHPALTDQRQTLDQIMFETRVNSTWDKRWNYLAGVFFRDRESDFRSFVPVTDPETGLTFDPGADAILLDPPVGPDQAPTVPVGAGIPDCLPCVFARRASKDIEEIAVFGELTYDITDRIELLAGLRWFQVDQTDFGITVFPFALFPPNPPLPLEQNAKEDQLIKKFQVSYKPTDEVTVFAVASQGFRLGGTNNQGVVDIPSLFESDEIWNFEFGWKTRWFDNRLTLNGSVFHILWDNLQVDADDPTGAFGFVTNAGEAEVTGVELEASAFPTSNLQFSFGLSWLPRKQLTEDQETTVIIGGDEVTLIAPGIVGDEIPRIPEVTLNGIAQYNFDIDRLPNWNGWLRGEFSYRSKSRTELRPFEEGNGNDRPQDEYAIVNLRAGFENAAWDSQFIVFVENVANVQGDVFISAQAAAPTFKITNTPRTIGVQLSKRF